MEAGRLVCTFADLACPEWLQLVRRVDASRIRGSPRRKMKYASDGGSAPIATHRPALPASMASRFTQNITSPRQRNVEYLVLHRLDAPKPALSAKLALDWLGTVHMTRAGWARRIYPPTRPT